MSQQIKKWVGRKVLKRFSEGTFEGVVTACEREAGTNKLLCHVVYSDGDSEDLYLAEARTTEI